MNDVTVTVNRDTGWITYQLRGLSGIMGQLADIPADALSQVSPSDLSDMFNQLGLSQTDLASGVGDIQLGMDFADNF